MNPNTLLNELDDLESELNAVRRDQERPYQMTNAELSCKRETLIYLDQVESSINRIREYLGRR